MAMHMVVKRAEEVMGGEAKAVVLVVALAA